MEKFSYNGETISMLGQEDIYMCVAGPFVFDNTVLL